MTGEEGQKAEGATPAAGGPAPAARRRSWPRRIVRGLVGLGLLVLLLLAFVLAFLHTPAGITSVRVFLEAWGSRVTGGTLRLGSLDLALWEGRGAVTAVSFSLEGIALDAERVELGWSREAGAHLRLLRPRIVVHDTGEPDSKRPPAIGLSAQPWRALERLGRAEVVDGRLELRDAKGAPSLVLGRFGAEMTEEGGRRKISVRIAEAGMGWPALPTPASASATLALDGGRLAFEQANVTAGGSSVDLRGHLDRISPVTATASVRAAFDGALVEALAGSNVVGRLEADATVEVKDDRVTGTLTASSPALRLNGLGPWAASGRGRFDGPRFVLESLEARGYGGRLVAEGPLALTPSEKTDVRVRAEGFDVATLAAAFASADVPVAARAEGSLRWATTGWDVDAARGTGAITLRPSACAARPPAAPGLPLSGSGSVRITGRALALEGARVEARGARVTAEGALGAAGNVRGSWSATLPLSSVNALLTDLGSTERLAETYTGTLVAEGELAGPVSSLVHGGTLRAHDLAIHGHAHSLEARGHYSAGRLGLAPLLVRSGFGQATLTGSVPVLADAGEWDLRGEIEALDLAPALALAGLEGEGPATGTLRIEGPRDAPRGRVALDARVVLDEAGGATGEPIAVALSASSDGGRVEVDRLTAETAGGRVEGSGRFDGETHVLEATAHAEGLAWARLPLLPASARRLGGTLAADVSLGGTTEAPSGEAHATLGEATLDGSPLPAIALDAHADGRRLEIGGRAGEKPFLKGTGELEGDWPARLEVDVAGLPAQALLDVVAAGRLPGATLEARGAVVLDVALRDPERLRYAGEGLAASGRLQHLEWSVDPFEVDGSAEEATVAGLRLRTRASERPGAATRAEAAEEGEPASPAAPDGGVLTVDGRVPFAEGRTFDLAVKGDFALAAIEAIAPNSLAGGRLSLQTHVGGTVAAPDLDGTFGVVDGRVRVEDAGVTAVQVAGRFQGREALLDRTSVRLLGGQVSVSGSFPLAQLDAGRSARLRFEATDVDLSRLAVPGSQRTAASPSFLVSVSGDLEATAPSLAGLRGEGQLTRVESRTQEGTFGLAAPAPWHLAGGRFVQETLRLASPLGTLEANAEITLDRVPAGSVTLAGPFDLRLVSPFVPDTTLAGPARVDLRAKWDASGARLEGLFSVDGGRVTLDTLAFTASQLRGEVRFLGDRAEIDATAAAGDGRIVAYGGMNFGPRLLGPAAMSIEAERVPVSYPEGFRGRATGAILVGGDVGGYRISGLVDLTHSHYTAEFDARRESLDRIHYQLAALRGQGSITDNLPLAVDVRLKDPLRVRNSKAQLDVTGTFTVNGTLAQPTATGQVSLIEGGRITIRRARIRALVGRAELNGYPAGVPDGYFEGLTQVGGVTISLRAQGSMNDLALDIRSPNRP
ncbi:MAG TPA: translocation/assembly module TamB domain-containing protein, partial [Vicinamibacteria bacterium]|nr:translocation/assembly module TamB domain-containing protein [Vicinamibacteria bacterium]